MKIEKNMYCAMIFVKRIFAEGKTYQEAIQRSASYYKVNEDQLRQMLQTHQTNKLKYFNNYQE